MSQQLSSTIRPGIVNVAGKNSESHKTAELLLEEDRQKHHCFFNPAGFHNHLSHHILAAYDLGAPATLLQAIYDSEAKILRPIDQVDKQELENLTEQNWTNYLGQEIYYSSYLALFKSVIAVSGVGNTLENYVFSPAANGNGSHMMARFFGGVMHPTIQAGYGAEFGSDVMIAQALAQAAVHKAQVMPELYEFTPIESCSQTPSLFQILRQVYDSSILKPVMPYDPDALLSARIRDAREGGRPEEIKRLCTSWFSPSDDEEHLAMKLEELFWVSTLLFAGTGKPGRKPRLDFFLLHILNATLFLPSLFDIISTRESKVKLLRGFLSVTLMYTILRGRPRINPNLIMAYTATPSPPDVEGASKPQADSCALGNPNDPAYVNPWPAILTSVIHVPDAHTIKAIRTLYYAAQQYGHRASGDVVGAFDNQEETHEGIGKMDGTIFVRAAGVVIDTMGWVTHGQKGGSWDRSALGWDDAWEGSD